MGHPNAFITPGKAATIARKAFRREVAAGRAAWTAEGYGHDERGRLADVPKKARPPFGQGILRSLPTYRAPFTMEDAQWWAEECRREEDREIDRLAARAEADARFDGWF